MLVAAAFVVSGFFVFGSVAQAAGVTYYVSSTGVDTNDCITPETACLTIQVAVAKASAENDIISIANGSYPLGSTLNISTANLTIHGESKDGVIIDASSVNGYGIAPSADNITLEGFTLIGPAADADSSYGIKASHISGFIARNVTVKGSGRSEFDLNTVNGGLLENITADGQNTAGVGVALSHSNDITLRDITTQDNTWGGVGLFDTTEGATVGAIFEGTNTFGESNLVYIDAEYSFGATNITLPGFSYAVRNLLNPRYTSFQQSESAAINVALAPGAPINTASYIQTLGTDNNGYIVLENNFIVGNGMSIQTAINAANSGDTINVAAGTYDENVEVNKENLTVASAEKHGAVIEGTVVITANGVTVDGFSIKNFSQIPFTDWSGVYIPSGTGIRVANNLIDGTGIDPVANLTVGIHTLYGGTAGATLEGNIVRNVRLGIYNQGAVLLISKNTIENTAHCAIGVDTSLGTTITGNTISNSASLGIEVFGVNVVANFNNITGSAVFGVWSAGPQVDATNNWWGAVSGPSNLANNPGGTGDAITDNVTFNPWYTNAERTSLAGQTTTSGDNKTLTLPAPVEIVTADLEVEIPISTTVTGPTDWDGTISAPTVQTVAKATPSVSGYSIGINTIIEIGYADAKLTFDKAVRLLLPGQAGRRVGYARTGQPFTEITTGCTDDTQAAADAQLTGDIEDCKVGVGPDLVVWTKHFTQFVTYTQTAIPASRGGGGSDPSPPTTNASPLSAAAQQVDANKDGKVDVLDFVSLMANWNKTGLNIVGDFNNDGKVDVLDFVMLMANWTK